MSQNNPNTELSPELTDHLKSVPPPIPEDLNQLWNSVKTVSTIHGLLDSGMFRHTQMSLVKGALSFMQSMHEQVVDAACAHPESDLIPEIKELKAERVAKDGQAN